MWKSESQETMLGNQKPQVPAELTRSIVEFVADSRTLATLSRVSRALNHEAERVLYHAPFPCNREQSIALLNVMATNARVAAHVDTLIVDMTEDRHFEFYEPELQGRENPSSAYDFERGSEYFKRYLHSLENALKNMPKLRALKIFPDVTYDPTTSAWPLRLCTGRLRELRCGFAWDEELVGFLSAQPEIVDLCLEHDLILESQTVPDTLVPKLSIFEGMPTTAMKFCPQRPVTHLSIWLEGNSNLTSLIPQLALSTMPILSLELADYNLVSLSEVISAGAHIHFPQLRFLGPCIVTPWDEEACLNNVALFKHLHTLLLLDFERQPRSPDTSGVPAQRTFVTRLHIACPSLQRVALSYSVGQPWSCLWVFESDGWVCHENAPLRFLWKDV